jgi:ribosomal protein S3
MHTSRLAVQGWEEVKKSRGKKKVSEAEIDGDETEEHEVFLYVERKHFGTIIGPAGANLRAITEVLQTCIHKQTRWLVFWRRIAFRRTCKHESPNSTGYRV